MPERSLGELADLITPMAIHVAATLRVADGLATGPRTATELAAPAGVDAGVLARVLDHLVAGGMFTRDDAGRYDLTEMGDALRADHPSRLHSMLDMDGGIGHAELALVQLLHSVQTGEAAFPVQFGRPFWDHLEADAERSARYAEEMGGDVAAWSPAIIAAYDWASVGRVVDVGGGNGTLLIALLRAFPDLRGTVVDLPQTAAAAHGALDEADLLDRGGVAPGSFFEPLPRGAGGYILTAIIHDWDDEPARAILAQCRDAAGADGRVFVIEKIGTDGINVNTGMDLRLLVYFGGKERNRDDLVALTRSAGLDLIAVHDAGSIAILDLRSASSP